MQLCVLTRVPYGEHDMTNMYRLPNAHESLKTSNLVVRVITMGAGMHADPHTGQRQLASQSPHCVRHSTCAANTDRRYQSHEEFALHAMLALGTLSAMHTHLLQPFDVLLVDTGIVLLHCGMPESSCSAYQPR